jgi:O-antigen/teichoic acid export membrane protein
MTITAKNPLNFKSGIRGKSVAKGVQGRDFSWALCGNVAYSMSQWALVMVLAKTGSAEHVGGYALGIAISSPLLTFANCQGRNLVASDIKGRYTFGDYLRFRLLSMGAAMAAVAFVAGWVGSSRSAIAVTCMLGLSQAFDWISETYFGLMQKHDRLYRAGQSLMIKGPLCLLLMTAAMYATRSLVWAAFALLLARGLVLVFFDARVATQLAGPPKAIWRPGTFSGIGRSALPLGVIAAIAAFNFNIPRYFIENYLSTRDLGIFSAIASLVGAGNLVMSALANSSFVAIARAVAKGDRREYRILSLRLLGTAGVLGLAGVAVSMLLGRELLVRLFHPEYAASAGVFTRLMMAGAIGYVISGQGYALTAARVLTPQIPILLSAAVSTALFCRWLVPLRGIEGAADAWLLSSMVTLTMSSLMLARVRPNASATPAIRMRRVVGQTPPYEAA